MKSTKITTLLHNIYPKAGDSKYVKVKDYNNLKDDFDALRPSDTASKADTISEVTSGSGVTVDGVRLKDSGISTGTSKVVTKTVEVLLSSANLQAMYTTPVSLVAAPGAGYVLAFEKAVLIYDSTATAYTGGGVITINYGGGGAAQSSNLAATFLTGAGDKIFNLEKLNAASGLTMPVNTALVITNASGAFATGTGVCRCYITYSVYETGL